MPRFLSATPNARLLPLPWSTPLADWTDEYLVALPRGISRHVVRFIRVGDDVFAAKEVAEELAIHEYRLLGDLRRMGTPAVEPMAVVSGRTTKDGTPLDPILLTKHLQYALPYRSLFTPGVRHETVTRLLDAMVVLIARLHLQGFMWNDMSLSNILFRRDAGEFAAYLVDAETGELHDRLSDGQREHDLEIGLVNIFGDFCDLAAGGLLDAALDAERITDAISQRYAKLWHELTGVEEFAGSESHRIEGRVRRLNALGFDIAELDIRTSPDGQKIKIQPKVVDAGHHSRRLLRLTGLDTEENQARRLLNDLDTYRVRNNLQHLDESVLAHRWLTQVFEPVIEMVPEDLLSKRDPAQIFHEVLDYRWYQSEREKREVPLLEAMRGYIRDVLAELPDEGFIGCAPVTQSRTPLNPYDPSMGFCADESLDPVDDPWEADDSQEEPAEMTVITADMLRGRR